MTSSHLPDHRQMPSRKLIGGIFGLESVAPSGTGQASLPNNLHGEWQGYVNGRSALNALWQTSAPSRIWLPAYLCPSVATAAARCAPVTFCDRGATAWLDEVQVGDSVLFLAEFGFPPDRESVATARARGAKVVVDACQALLTDDACDGADYAIFSPRKFLGVVDGGVLVAPRGAPLPNETLSPPPATWLEQATLAAQARAEFDRGAGKSTPNERDWFPLYQQVEATQPVGPYAMGDLSQSILSGKVDWQTIRTRRRSNYQSLLAKLKPFALYPELPAGVVPLGFPIRLENRDHVRSALFADEIFPPIHWPLHELTPAECVHAWRLSRSLLTLPCDQRYDAAEMQRSIEIVLREGRPCLGT